MKSVAYPIILEKEADGYFVTVPDIDRYTQGEDIADAMEMARDLICLWLLDLEESGKSIPQPASMELNVSKDAIVTFVDVNLDEYRKKYGTRVVKKIVRFRPGSMPVPRLLALTSAKLCRRRCWPRLKLADFKPVMLAAVHYELLLFTFIEGIVHFRLDFWLTWCYSLHIGMSAQTGFRLITKSIKRIGEDDIYA